MAIGSLGGCSHVWGWKLYCLALKFEHVTLSGSSMWDSKITDITAAATHWMERLKPYSIWGALWWDRLLFYHLKDLSSASGCHAPSPFKRRGWSDNKSKSEDSKVCIDLSKNLLSYCGVNSESGEQQPFFFEKPALLARLKRHALRAFRFEPADCSGSAKTLLTKAFWCSESKLDQRQRNGAISPSSIIWHDAFVSGWNAHPTPRLKGLAYVPPSWKPSTRNSAAWNILTLFVNTSRHCTMRLLMVAAKPSGASEAALKAGAIRKFSK